MKIRTDFVTNSSSVSTAEVVIDNPVLLEILQKYKDMGAFGPEKPLFGIGEYFSYDEYFVHLEEKSEPKTPAFYFYENLCGDGWSLGNGCPKTVGEVLGKIIAIIDDSERYVKVNRELMDQMKAELHQRAEEIKNKYAKVYWDCEDITDLSGPDEIGGWFFSYDPVNGEKFAETKARETSFFDDEDDDSDHDE
jgi:hypothetical protein